MNNLELELIRKAKLGDVAYFENLIIRYESTVYNIAYRMFNNAEDAKDISQEVFIKVYKNIIKFNEESNFSTWLYRITVNTCIDEIRKRKNDTENRGNNYIETEDGPVEIEHPSYYNVPENELLKKETKNIVKEALNEISEEHKAVLILKDIEGYSYDEIAEILEITLGTVKSRISRAREALKKTLEQNYKYVRQNDRREGESYGM